MRHDLKLSDDVLILRCPRAADVPVLLQAVQESLPELHPWMDWATEAYNEASARRWVSFAELAWEHSTAFQFAITDAETGAYLGNCGLDGINEKNRFCNLGYWVRTSQTGRGVASRAVRLAARFAFETLGLKRAEIVIARQNLASQRTAEKAGAHYEGILLNRMVIRTEVNDALMYSLTPTDFGLTV